jgi:hypothetical protein
MFKWHTPSPALVVAFIALLVAVGGAAFAAIPDKAGVVHSCYQKNGGGLRVVDTTKHGSAGKCRKSEKALTWSQRGPIGAQGLQGAQGALGTPGPPGRSALTALQPGESESGAWGLGGTATSTSQLFLTAATFPIPLGAGLSASHVVYVASGTQVTHCAGVGQADSGYLCVYEQGLRNVAPDFVTPIQRPTSTVLTEAGNAGAERNGFLVVLYSKEAGNVQGWGTWTVTG